MNTLLFPKMGSAGAFRVVLFFALTHSILCGSPFPNGGFEESTPSRDLGAGVDSTGFAACQTTNGAVPSAMGGIGGANLGFSVNVADLNDDDLADIAAIDGLGFMRIFFNSGTKQAPKFTHAETTSHNLFPLPRPTNWVMDDSPEANAYKNTQYLKSGQRMALYNDGSKLNMLVATLQGNLFSIPNSGSSSKPDFKTPSKTEQTPIKATSRPFLAQALSPFVVDWNKDSKPDVVFGEGSYSANSIFILVNKASAISKFDDNDRHLLASGMGMEQLSPCVVDYNGDRQLDLLVTERGGRIAVYLSPATPWKPGDTIPFYTFLTKDGAPLEGVPAIDEKKTRDPADIEKAKNLINTGGVSTIATGDFNGDGLFDIVVAKPNGRIAMAINAGTATEPKFGTLNDLKVEAASKEIRNPKGWSCETGLSSGNQGAFATVAKKDEFPGILPVEGESFLHLGYSKFQNAVMDPPKFRPPETQDSNSMTFLPNAFTLETSIPTIKCGKTYAVSFSARGNRVKSVKINAYLRFAGGGTYTTKEVETKRGSAQVTSVEGRMAVDLNLNEVISVTDQWKKITTKYAVYNGGIPEDLKGADPIRGGLVITVTLEPGVGDFSMDDVQIIEK